MRQPNIIIIVNTCMGPRVYSGKIYKHFTIDYDERPVIKLRTISIHYATSARIVLALYSVRSGIHCVAPRTKMVQI